MKRPLRWTVALALATLLGAGHPAVAVADAGERPKVVLDHLEFPLELGAKKYKKHLERALAQAARQADWGASSDSRIEYRFEITRLAVSSKNDRVITVSCAAVGRLPHGRSANSKLSFSGSPAERDALVKKVLTIVARGVIARLAEMERVRRGELADQRVRPPTDGE